MTPARMRRLASDYEEVRKNFAGHKNIIVTPIGEEPPEKYHVTYFVNGIYLLPDGRIEMLNRHEVDITLHAEYPRYKPICKIQTPIWHPNFRDGQICIGDIWGAGESLTDIIINIGDMIQYKSWNSYSPLSSEAAQWAMENKHLFPVGNIDLFYADYASAKDDVEIDLFDDDGTVVQEPAPQEQTSLAPEAPVQTSLAPEAPMQTSLAADAPAGFASQEQTADGNDFEITAEELAGIEFVPTAQRMQTVAHGGLIKGRKVNFKTILIKGLLWALLGAFLGFAVSELTDGLFSTSKFAAARDYEYLSEYLDYSERSNDEFNKAVSEFEKYCRKNNLDSKNSAVFTSWIATEASDEAHEHLDEYSELDNKAQEALYDSFLNEFDEDSDAISEEIKMDTRLHTACWSAVIALLIGLLLGIGEGVYYGSFEKALMYAAIGAGISVVMGFISGYLAQWMYATLLEDDPSDIAAAFIRGLGWAIMGLGIGASAGLIKPALKRILFCVLGGTVGAFVGGFLFNFVFDAIPNDMVARGIAIVIMGGLIGLGVGLLEQFAKQAWLKVIRGEFEGKEYLVFAGTTSIGNNGKNTIVLFKDKLVGPHHCDIVLEGSKYSVVDCGTPMGTIVNGRRVARQVLKRGDTIAVGNSVLVFNTK